MILYLENMRLARQGEDITYFITTSAVIDYENELKTIINAKNFFQNMNSFLIVKSSYEKWEDILLEDIRTSCILGEAYFYASLVYNYDEREDVNEALYNFINEPYELRLIPNFETFMSVLRKLLYEYLRKGYLIDSKWLDVVNEYFCRNE